MVKKSAIRLVDNQRLILHFHPPSQVLTERESELTVVKKRLKVSLCNVPQVLDIIWRLGYAVYDFLCICSFLGKGMIKAKPPTVYEAVRNHMTRHVYDRMLKVTICGLSQHLDSSQSSKFLEQKFIFQIGTFNTYEFHSTNLFLISCHHIPTSSVAPISAHNPQFLQSLWRRACARKSAFKLFSYGG